jgi:hypothetical protein
VPRHVARLVMRLIALLVVDYSASCRLVVDYFASAVRPGASARRAARHAARRAAHRRVLRIVQARRRLLHLRRASRCLGTSRGSSLVVDYSTSHRLVVDYSASRRLIVDDSASRRLVVDYFEYVARLGASARRAAHRLSSTTSPTPRDRVPRHVVRLVAWLVAPLLIDYFAYATHPGASACRAARHAANRRLLRAPLLRLAGTLALLQPRRAS